GPGGLWPGPAQFGRLRLGSTHPGIVVYEQRTRPAGRRFAARHAEPCPEAGIEFRLSVLSLGRGRRPGLWKEAFVQRIRDAGTEARPACRAARYALLYRNAVPGDVP